MTSREINKQLSVIWNNFSKQEKEKYMAESRSIKTEIQANMKSIEDKLGIKIKKAVCAYSMFVKDKRYKLLAQYPELHHIEIMKKIS